jgi:diguanylate cyclase (GGDEF)-like protein/PAS domain S-box-containing protein
MVRTENLRRLALSSLAAAIALAAIAIVLIHLVMDTGAGVRGFINAEALWSKAQKDSVFALDRYAEIGDPAALAEFREDISVILADREARLAMEQDPPQREQAAEQLVRGGNHPADVPNMVWLYTWFRDYGPMAAAIDIWERGDTKALALIAVADRLEAAYATPRPDATLIGGLRQELAALDTELRPLEDEFSATLGAAARDTAQLTFVAAGLVLLVAALLFVGTILWLNRKLASTEVRLNCMFEQASVGIAQLTIDGEFMQVNRTFAELLGYTASELLGRSCFEFTHVEDLERNTEQLRMLVAGRADLVATEKRYQRKDGGVVWVRISANLLQPDPNDAPFVVTFVEDVSEAHGLRQEIQRSAESDALTGLANRGSFAAALDDVLESNRSHAAQANLMIIDIDQFRLLNDTEGHAAGDAYLRRLAHRLQMLLRTHDLVGRLDGDLFAVLLMECGRQDAEVVAEKVRMEIEALRTQWGGREYQFTASIGSVHLGPDYPGDATAALSEADAACISAKQRGRNRIVIHDPEDMEIRGRQGQVRHIQRLRQAMEDDSFELYAQVIEPIGDSGTRARHVEVLLRLRDEEGEIIPTGEIIQAAEQFHLAAKLDQWVVRHAVGWLTTHAGSLDRISMCAINLSGQSLSDERTLREISRVVRLGAVPPHKICFEITETAAVANLEAARHFIQRLKRVGCRFSLDDFGSGTSSFSYLRELPVDFIKIDGAFVRNLCVDESNEAIVRSIVNLARDLGKRTIAEMVEEEAVMSRLVDFGVDYAQGYYVHRPMPIAEVLAA